MGYTYLCEGLKCVVSNDSRCKGLSEDLDTDMGILVNSLKNSLRCNLRTLLSFNFIYDECPLYTMQLYSQNMKFPRGSVGQNLLL